MPALPAIQAIDLTAVRGPGLLLGSSLFMKVMP
jgi:hypothetical protein